MKLQDPKQAQPLLPTLPPQSRNLAIGKAKNRELMKEFLLTAQDFSRIQPQKIGYHQRKNTFQGNQQKQNLSYSIDLKTDTIESMDTTKNPTPYITQYDSQSHQSKSTFPSTAKNISSHKQSINQSIIFKQAEEQSPITQHLIPETSISNHSLKTIEEFNNSSIQLPTENISLMNRTFTKDTPQSRNVQLMKVRNITDVSAQGRDHGEESFKSNDHSPTHTNFYQKRNTERLDSLNQSKLNMSFGKNLSESKVHSFKRRQSIRSKSPTKVRNPHIEHLQDRAKFIDLILYLKGLNAQYKEEIYHDKLELKLERKLINSNIKLNKNMIMSQVKKSFYNNTFLVNLKKQKANIDAALAKMGLNLEAYRSIAKNMIHQDHYRRHHKQKEQQDEQSSVISSEDEKPVEVQTKQQLKFVQYNKTVKDIYRGKHRRHNTMDNIVANDQVFLTQSIDMQNVVRLDSRLDFSLTQRLKRKKVQKLPADSVESVNKQLNQLLLKTNDNFFKQKLKAYNFKHQSLQSR